MITTTDSKVRLTALSKFSRKILRTSFWVIFGAANLSMTWESLDWFLSEADRQMEETQDRPALAAPLDQQPYWESFNEWQCFHVSTVRFSCVGHFLSPTRPEEETPLPSLRVELDDEVLDFDYDEDPETNCQTTLEIWKQLINDERSVCLYAAYLQEIDDNNSYWILKMFKTARGSWPPPSESDNDTDHQDELDAIDE